MNPFDAEYNKIGLKLLNKGFFKNHSRSNGKCLTLHDDMMKFDLSLGFPILTTKKVLFKPMVAELIGFLRGYDNANDFMDLGCNFWNANANDNEQWLNNSNRKCDGDLGRIYGVQARNWDGVVDQLYNAYGQLVTHVDNRRIIVSHWNPSELDKMCLPPCHLLYQFHIREGYLDLTLYQRSCDFALGIPMNISSYSLLLMMMSKITGLKCGVFTHMMGDIHLYENQIDLFSDQMRRSTFTPPSLKMPNLRNFSDMVESMPCDYELCNYSHHDFIKFPFTV